MSTPPAQSKNDSRIDANSTYEGICLFLEKIMSSGSSLPDNVVNDFNPYSSDPKNLPDGFWFFIRSEDKKTVNEHGSWQTNGEACEVFSNDSVIGWMTILDFYQGQLPHQQKTDWIMQDFRITQKRLSQNTEAKEADSLCRLFCGTEQISKTRSFSAPLFFPNTDNGNKEGEPSEPQVLELFPVIDFPIENVNEIDLDPPDYVAEDDYLDLQDLEDAALSDSSINTSLTLSSDEYFDSEALLRDIEAENIRKSTKKNDGYKFSVSVANQVILSPPITGSRVSICSSQLSHEESVKANFSKPVSVTEQNNLSKPVVGNQRRDISSLSPLHDLATPSHDNDAAADKRKKSPISRTKRLPKKYFCCMPF
ncbi:hypothetical protein ACFE04_007470 [Oxalis oulophora]